MKKKTLLTTLVSLMSISLIAGCDNDEVSKNVIGDMLKECRDGIKLDIKVDQTLRYIDKYYGDYTGKKDSHSVNAEVIFQEGEQRAFSTIINDYYLDGFNYELVNMQVFEGEDGYAYYYEQDYKNEVNMLPFIDGENEKVNYNYYCLNPFNFILEEDFTKINDTTYSLSKSKSAFFATAFLGDIDESYYGVIDKCEFNFVDDNLYSITVVPHASYKQRTEGYKNVYYVLEQTATLEVKEKGEGAKVEVLKPNAPVDTAEINKLQAAFEKLKDRNYTVSLNATFDISKMQIVEEGEEKPHQIYHASETVYYTGKHVYFSFQQDQSEPSVDNDFVLYDDGGQYLVPLVYSEADSIEEVTFTAAAAMGNYGGLINSVTYNDIAPKISEVNANIFNYNKEKNSFTICDNMKSYIASIALVPPITEFSLYLMDYGSGMEVFLNDNGELDRIEFSYLYHDGFNYDDGKVVMKFSNVGTTVLPHNLVPVV